LTKNCPDRVASAEVTIGGRVGAVAVDEAGGWVMGGYQRYEAYRDSGVEWLGEIPAHWDAKRSRFLLVTNPSKNEIRLPDDTPVSFIAMESVGEYGGLDLTVQKTLDEIGSGYTYFAEEDVVVAKITPCFENGKGAISLGLTNKIAFGTTELHVLRPSENLIPLFLFYLTISYPFRKLGESEMYGAGGQKRVPEKFLKDLRISVPPLEEQRSIARFLDYKTAQIDALIAKKESLLKKLAEKRSALISQAVTKGLDPKVPMKDSGVDWLGEIPAHWEAVRLRYCSEFVTSGSRGWAQYYSDAGSVFLRIANVSRSGIELKLNDVQRVIPPSGAEGDRAKAFPGDVIVSITADLGSVAYIPDDFEVAHVSQHLALLRPISVKVSSRWIAYSIFADVGKTQLLSSGYGGTKIQLNLTDVKDLWIALPPISEQLLIDQDIQKNIKTLTDLELRVEGAIERLKEYRTALITNAVTGAIDVRNIPIPNNLQEAA
jgi:type I restriction enzyme, S subunit